MDTATFRAGRGSSSNEPSFAVAGRQTDRQRERKRVVIFSFWKLGNLTGFCTLQITWALEVQARSLNLVDVGLCGAIFFFKYTSLGSRSSCCGLWAS